MKKFVEVFFKDNGDPHPLLWMWGVNSLLASALVSSRLRVQFYRLFGLKIDRRAAVRPGVFFRSSDVTVGESTFIGYNAFFDCRGGIRIGRNVGIGSYTVFVDSDHEIDDPASRAGRGVRKPIIIHDGARISTRSIILPGVTVGEGAVVGAGSLVTKDCDPHGLYVGVPAKKIRELPH